jgi:hypothetical protein
MKPSAKNNANKPQDKCISIGNFVWYFDLSFLESEAIRRPEVEGNWLEVWILKRQGGFTESPLFNSVDRESTSQHLDRTFQRQNTYVAFDTDPASI